MAGWPQEVTTLPKSAARLWTRSAQLDMVFHAIFLPPCLPACVCVLLRAPVCVYVCAGEFFSEQRKMCSADFMVLCWPQTCSLDWNVNLFACPICGNYLSDFHYLLFFIIFTLFSTPTLASQPQILAQNEKL